MASRNNLNAKHDESFEDTGKEKSIQITLSATPETVTTISIPSDYKGFRIYSANDNVIFAVNATVVAVGTSSATTIASSAFTVGGVALSGQWETRLLPPSTKQKSTDAERYITLYSLVASTVLTLEIF